MTQHKVTAEKFVIGLSFDSSDLINYAKNQNQYGQTNQFVHTQECCL